MSGGGTETPLYRTTTFLRHQAAGPESGTHRRKGPRDPRDDLPGDQYGRRRRAGTGWQSPPVYLQPRCRHKGMMYTDRKSTRLNSSHLVISYAVFCLKKKKQQIKQNASIV